jgi:hypothetical protein
VKDGSTPVATDPLGAIRVELVGAARRRVAARRRRRRVATVTATVVATLALAASAGALISGTTGVGAVDEFLGRVEVSGQGGGSDRAGEGGPIPSLAPAASGSASAPLELTDVGVPGTSLVAYVSSGGPICSVLLRPHGEGAGEAREGWGCVAPDALSRSLAGDSVLLADVRSDGHMLVSGYAGHNVEEIDVSGPGGPFDVRMAKPWTPDVDGAATVRPFLAVGRATDQVATSPNAYVVTERLDDGRTIEVTQ